MAGDCKVSWKKFITTATGVTIGADHEFRRSHSPHGGAGYGTGMSTDKNYHSPVGHHCRIMLGTNAGMMGIWTIMEGILP